MKIKKFITTLALCFMFVFGGAMLVGCGPQVANLDIIGTLPRVAVNTENTQPDWSGVSAKITFADGTEKFVDKSQLVFGTVDTTTVGSKPVTVKYIGSDKTVTVYVEVYAPQIQVAVNAYFGTYDGTAHDAVSVTGTQSGDVVKYSTDNKQTWLDTVPKYKNVGEYPVAVKVSRDGFDDKIENYLAKVTKANLVVTAENKSFEYDTTVPELTVKYEGFVNGEDTTNLSGQLACTIKNSQKQTVVLSKTMETGSYTIIPSGLTADNYDITFKNGTLYVTVPGEKLANSWVAMPKVAVSAPTTDVKYFVGEPQYGTPTRTFKTLDGAPILLKNLAKNTEYIMTVTVEETESYTGLYEEMPFVINDIEIESLEYSAANLRDGKFAVIGKTIVAGDDNVFKLQILATDVLLDEYNVFESEITLKIKQGTDFVNVVDNGEYVKIDNYHQYLYFTEEAVDELFEITVSANGADPISFEVQVRDAFNVYTASDLSVIENMNSDIHGWQTWKAGTIYENLKVNGVAIQNDISVTDADIPSEFFYSELEASAVPSGVTNQTIAGTLKDGDGNGTGGNNRALYARILGEGETFNFYGNYYTVDYKDLSRCVVQAGHKLGVYIDDVNTSNEKPITTHVTFMRFDGPLSGVSKENMPSINMVDANFIGNGARSDRAVYSGGAMLGKIDAVNSVVDNCCYSNTFIGFMYDGGTDASDLTTNVLSNTQGTNCYNTLLYVWGEKDLTIKGGSFIGAGGPVMIVDYVYDDDTKAEHPSNVTIIGTELESFVTGNEPWFVSYGATALVAQITAYNAYYAPFNSTFLQSHEGVNNMMNLKVVYKSSASEGITASVVKGGVTYYNTQADYDNRVGSPVHGLDMTTYSILAAQAQQSKLQNSSNGDILGLITYAVVPLGSDYYVTKIFNLQAINDINAQDIEPAQKIEQIMPYIEGQLIEGTVHFSDGTTVTPELLSMSMGGVDLTVFNIEPPSLTYPYGVRAASGETDINYYLFNGMGIVIELYPLSA